MESPATGKRTNEVMSQMSPTSPSKYTEGSSPQRPQSNLEKARMIADSKQVHSAFYYKLLELNEKISLFTDVFYSKMPSHQMAYYNR